MTVYGAFRKPFDDDDKDHRIIFHGIHYLLKEYICRKWTAEDLERSEKFFSTHHAGYSPFPWPKDLFHKVILSLLLAWSNISFRLLMSTTDIFQ